MKIGLALGGGGARGLAHLGVIRALSMEGIKPDILAGTSMGAIIAVAYAQEQTYAQLELGFKQFVLDYAKKFEGMREIESKQKKKQRGVMGEIFQSILTRLQLSVFAKKKYLEDGSVLDSIVEQFICPCNLEELPLPIFVSSLDMISGKGVFLVKGDTRKALKASLSIAGYFPGVPLGNRLLYDAQAVFPVPIQSFQYADVDLIISSVVDTRISKKFYPNNLIDLLFRQNDIAFTHVASEIENCSDVFIHPGLSRYHWTDFHKMEPILEQGYYSAKKKIPEILKFIEGKQKPKPINERPWHNSGFQKRIELTGFPHVDH